MTRLSDETRAKVITFPGNDHEASAATGVARRTVSDVRAKYRDNPDVFGSNVRRMVEGAQGDSLDLVRRVREDALKQMLARVNDPKTRAGELAAIFREVRDEASLLEGRATSRAGAEVTPEDYAAARQLDDLYRALQNATPQEIAEWIGANAGFVGELVTVIREPVAELEAWNAEREAGDV